MSEVSRPAWLERSYALALVVHAAFFAGFVGLAIVVAATLGVGVNAARDSVFLTVAIFLVRLLPAVPSGFALLSWWLCQRRGWRPSTGHMSLTVATAALLLIVILVTAVS